MNRAQILKHVLTLFLSFGGVAWFIWRYELTAYQVSYAAVWTILLMGGALSVMMGIGAAVGLYLRKRGVQ